MPATPRNDTTPDSLRIAHLSDTHLGYEAYRAVTGDGVNQRGQDFIDAFDAVCRDIDTWDPPLVIHSGDVIDRPQVPVRYLKAVTDGFARLAATRPDGTRRQVVVIEGNHDAPHSTREIAAVELLRRIDGVHVAASDTLDITFNPDTNPTIGSELAGVRIVAVPHDALVDNHRRAAWTRLTPDEHARWNILTSHGIAGGSELYQRGIGRELAIPTSLLQHPWDYVALGHWHLRGPIDDDARIWYAGSTENCGFGDLRDNGHQRGWLAITLDTTGRHIEPRNTPIRKLRNLEPINAEALTGEQITRLLVERIHDADTTDPINGCVLNQIVDGARRHTWSLVDTQPARQRATDALHYQLTLRPGTHPERKDTNDHTDTTEPRGIQKLDTALETAASRLPGRRRRAALNKARDAIANERQRRETTGRSGTARHTPRDATTP